MEFRFLVTYQLEREYGKFASRDELGDQLRENLEAADPGDLEGDTGGVYSVTDMTVEDA